MEKKPGPQKGCRMEKKSGPQKGCRMENKPGPQKGWRMEKKRKDYSSRVMIIRKKLNLIYYQFFCSQYFYRINFQYKFLSNKYESFFIWCKWDAWKLCAKLSYSK